jgi:O-succinylbenzoate synthase
MKIEQVVLRRLELPLLQPFETSFGRSTHKRFLLVSVAADGVWGHGECVADDEPFYLPETNVTVGHVLRDFLIPSLLALEFEQPRAVAATFARVRGHRMAKACLEMAVWDLCGRRAGQPLWRLLGGRAGRIQAGVSVGLQHDDTALVEQVAREVEAGYRRVKVKIKPGRDLTLVQAVRARFPELPLMVDANSAYTLADAEHLARLDPYALTMIEQPLAWDDIVDHATLQQRLRTALCLDESIGSADDARRALELGACRCINVKLGRIGGFASLLDLHAVCSARGVPLWCGGMLETGIGRLANVHAQTLPGFSLPGDTSASSRIYAEDLVDPPVTVAADGTIAVPDGPGLGHTLVQARVERATTAREQWRR